MVDSHVLRVADRQTQGVEPGGDEPLGEVSERRIKLFRLEVRGPSYHEALVEHFAPRMLVHAEFDVPSVQLRLEFREQIDV